MDDYRLTFTGPMLNYQVMRVKYNLGLIKKNKPQAVELIKKWEIDYESLDFCHENWKMLESEYRISRQRNSDMELICMKQQQEIEELKQKIKNLMDYV